MKLSKISLIVFSSLSSCAMASPATFDARQSAMGGTGVSGSNYLNAPLYNPALLAKHESDDDFGIILPTVGAELHDKNNLRNAVDDASDSYDNFQAAYNNFVSDSTSDNATKLVSANQLATDTLKSLQGDSGSVSGGAGMVMAMPMDDFSIALSLTTFVDVQAFADISNDDFSSYTINGTTITIPSNQDNLESKAIAYGAQVTDFGVSMAKQFDSPSGNQWLGITPKFQQLRVISYSANAVDSDFNDIADYESTSNGFNLDLGYAVQLTPEFVGGVAVKNIVPTTLTSPSSNGVQATYNIDPQVTVSGTWSPYEYVSFSADVDMFKENHFSNVTNIGSNFSDKNDDTQMMGVGAEWNLWGWSQIRAGYKRDMKNNINDMFTAGIGFSPFSVFHIDLTGMYGGSNDVGAALSTSLTF